MYMRLEDWQESRHVGDYYSKYFQYYSYYMEKHFHWSMKTMINIGLVRLLVRTDVHVFDFWLSVISIRND